MSAALFDSGEEDEYTSDYSSDEEEQALIPLPMAAECAHISHPVAEASFMDEVLPLSLEELYRRFLVDEAFWKRVCTTSECTEFSTSPWQERDCCNERVLKFTIPVKHILGPKNTPVTQTHTIRLRDKRTLELQTSSVSHNVPYADSFTVMTKWRAWSEETQGGSTRTWVKVHWYLHWNRSVWVRSLIERNAMEGAKEFLEGWFAAVKEVLRGESSVKEVRNDGAKAAAAAGQEKATSEESEKGEEDEEEDEEEEDEEADDESEGDGEQAAAGEAPPPPRTPKRSSGRPPRRKVAAERPQALQAQEGGGREQLPLLAFLLFAAVLLVAVALPLQSLRARAALRYATAEAEVRTAAESLAPRLSLAQAALAHLSHSLTGLPGAGLREQWERHWAALPVPCLEEAQRAAVLPTSTLYLAVARVWSLLLVVAKTAAAVATGALLVFAPYQALQSVF